MESAPTLCSPRGADKQREGWTLLSSTCIDGKGHLGCTSYSSSGVLIREDEQKTITGSLLPESQIFTVRVNETENRVSGHWKGIGVENQKKKRNISLC